MRSRLWLVLVFVVCFSIVPCQAHAKETDFIESFKSGLSTYGWFDDEEVTKEEEKPVFSLRAVENVSTKIQQVVTAWMRLQVNQHVLSPMQWILWVLLGTRLAGSIGAPNWIMATAFGLVFFWWGLRKCVRVIFKAFRKGKLNA